MIRVLLLAMLVISCGPSRREIAMAKLARYHGDKLVLFELARDAVARKHKIMSSDETVLTIWTRGRWYLVDGTAAVWQDGPGDTIDRTSAQRGNAPSDPFGLDSKSALPDKSLHFSLTIRILPEEKNWVVHIEPKVARFNVGMPILEPVVTSRIDTPPWVYGKIDQLAYEIHKSLRAYQVKGLSGSTPAIPFDPTPITNELPAEPHPVDLPPDPETDPETDPGAGSASPP